MKVRDYLIEEGLPKEHHVQPFPVRLLPRYGSRPIMNSECWGHKRGESPNREDVLAAVRQAGLSLYYAPKEFQADREVVLAAVKQNGCALADAAPDLQADRDVVLAAVRQDGGALAFAAPHLQDDQEVVQAALEKGCCTLAHGSIDLQADVTLADQTIYSYDSALRFASINLRGNKKLVQSAVEVDGGALAFAASALRADREIVLAAVATNGEALEHAAHALRADREIVLAAVKNCGTALWDACELLKADREVVLTAVNEDGRSLKYADPAFRADREVVLIAVKADVEALDFCSDKFFADREFVLAAVAERGEALKYFPKFRADREVVLTAVKENGKALRHAAAELKTDEKMVYEASLTELMLRLELRKWATLGDGRLVWLHEQTDGPSIACNCGVRLLLLLHAIERERHKLAHALIAQPSVRAVTTEGDVEQEAIHASILKALDNYQEESMPARILRALTTSHSHAFDTDVKLHRGVHEFIQNLTQNPDIVQDDTPLCLEQLLDDGIKIFTDYERETIQIQNDVLRVLEETKKLLTFYGDQLKLKPDTDAHFKSYQWQWQYKPLVPKIRELAGVICIIIGNQRLVKLEPPDPGKGDEINNYCEKIMKFNSAITRIASPGTMVGRKLVQSRLSRFFAPDRGTKKSAEEPADNAAGSTSNCARFCSMSVRSL